MFLIPSANLRCRLKSCQIRQHKRLEGTRTAVNARGAKLPYTTQHLPPVVATINWNASFAPVASNPTLPMGTTAGIWDYKGANLLPCVTQSACRHMHDSLFNVQHHCSRTPNIGRRVGSQVSDLVASSGQPDLCNRAQAARRDPLSYIRPRCTRTLRYRRLAVGQRMVPLWTSSIWYPVNVRGMAKEHYAAYKRGAR